MKISASWYIKETNKMKMKLDKCIWEKEMKTIMNQKVWDQIQCIKVIRKEIYIATNTRAFKNKITFNSIMVKIVNNVLYLYNMKTCMRFMKESAGYVLDMAIINWVKVTPDQQRVHFWKKIRKDRFTHLIGKSIPHTTTNKQKLNGAKNVDIIFLWIKTTVIIAKIIDDLFFIIIWNKK